MPALPAPRENRGGGALGFYYRSVGCLKCESDICNRTLIANLSRLAGRRVNLALREARDAGVAAHDRLALLERQHVVDVGEAVRRALLDRVDDALGSAAAVHLHDLRGRRR